MVVVPIVGFFNGIVRPIIIALKNIVLRTFLGCFSFMLTYLEMRMLRIETVAIHISSSASISSAITLMKIRPSSVVITTSWR